MKTRIKRHISGKPFECELCDYCSVNKFYMITHMRTHAGKKAYKCDLCNYYSKQKYTTMVYKRIHTDKSLLNVTYVITAVHINAMNKHMRVHQDEKPFKYEPCGYCSAQFAPRNHMKKHSSEKYFKSQLCDFGSARN